VVPHPLAKRDANECAGFAAAAIDEIIAALSGEALSLEHNYRNKELVTNGKLRHKSLFESNFNAPDAPSIFKAPESLTAVNRLFYQRGWTDGLPIIPPTPDLVEAMIGDRDPDEVIAMVEPQLGRGTISRLAANAVMAGCEPAYFPVVLAATRAMCDPRFNLKAIQSTTHPCTVMTVLSGPIVDDLEVNGSYNVMGQGTKANAAIGRAIRLILMNIGGAAPGVLDRSTMGSPAKFAFCFAENADASPWPLYPEELGLAADKSYVTVCGAEGPHNVNDHFGRNAEEILLTIAGTLASNGANNFYLAGQPIIVLGPEHADVIAAGGFSKADVRQFLSEKAIVSSALVSDAMKEVMHKRLPEHVLDNGDIRFITNPDDLIILVAGGAGRHSAVMPTFGHTTQAVTVEIS
jgi:hypothetical protein